MPKRRYRASTWVYIRRRDRRDNLVHLVPLGAYRRAYAAEYLVLKQVAGADVPLVRNGGARVGTELVE